MNITQQVIILSAELTTETTGENNRRTNNLRASLNDVGITFNEATGHYKNTQEASFVCLPKNAAEIETLKDFAFKNFKQESILFQDSNGQAYLIFEDKTEQNIGKLKQVNPKFIEQLENYTVMNNRVYTTEL